MHGAPSSRLWSTSNTLPILSASSTSPSGRTPCLATMSRCTTCSRPVCPSHLRADSDQSILSNTSTASKTPRKRSPISCAGSWRTATPTTTSPEPLAAMSCVCWRRYGGASRSTWWSSRGLHVGRDRSDQLQDARWRQVLVRYPHATLRERILDRIGQSRRRRDRTAFAHAARRDLVGRGHLQVLDFDGGNLHRRGQQIVHERSRQELTLVVVRGALQQHRTNPLSDAAADLAVDDGRVDDFAAILDHHP